MFSPKSYTDFILSRNDTIIRLLLICLTLFTGCKKGGNEISLPVPTAPAAPTNLTVTIISPSQIDLTWTDNSNDENGFSIERKAEGGSFAALTTVTANTTSYSDLSIAKGTAYSYRVNAFNAVGRSNSYTNEVAVTSMDVAPAAISALKAASVAYDRIALEWTDNASNESNYIVVRKSATADSTQFLLPANTNNFTDTGLLENTSYAYSVYPKNSYGNATGVELTAATPPNTESGLVAFYPFHGNASDSSGNKNDGTVYGARLSTDRFGKNNEAYYFNTDSVQYIKVEPAASLNNCRAITMAMWVKLSTYGRKDQIGFNHFVNKSDQADKHQFILASNVLGIYFYYNSGNNFYQSKVLPALNEWHHIAITYSYESGTNSQCRIYLDGTEAESFPITQPLPVTDFPLQFGSFANLSNSTLDGKLDDIRIYNRAITPAAVKYLSSH